MHFVLHHLPLALNSHHKFVCLFALLYDYHHNTVLETEMQKSHLDFPRVTQMMDGQAKAQSLGISWWSSG